MTGLPAAAVLADPAAAYDLFLPEHRERLARAEAAAIRDLEHFDVEAPMRRPDGANIRTRLISAPRLVDGMVILDRLHLDDTARRQAEEQLRESESRLRLATEAAEIGLWDVDEVNETLFWPARVKGDVRHLEGRASLHTKRRSRSSRTRSRTARSSRRRSPPWPPITTSSPWRCAIEAD